MHSAPDLVEETGNRPQLGNRGSRRGSIGRVRLFRGWPGIGAGAAQVKERLL